MIKRQQKLALFLASILLGQPTAAIPYYYQVYKKTDRAILYAPWRDSYVTQIPQKPNNQSCPFCTQEKAQDDDKYFILYRGHHNFIIMNAYPYAKAHLLIMPYAHLADLKELPSIARYELLDLAIMAMEVLKKTIKPDGFNVGFNIGRNSGASVINHIHMHVIPRKKQKVPGFCESIAHTAIIEYDLIKTFKLLKTAFQTIETL